MRTAGFDDLRDEGCELVEMLRREGVALSQMEADALTHDFTRWQNIVADADRYSSLIAQFIEGAQTSSTRETARTLAPDAIAPTVAVSARAS